MRRRLVLGLGLAGVLSGSAGAQQPGGGYVPPVGGFQPAAGFMPAAGQVRPATGFTPAGAAVQAAPVAVEIPSALGPNHPWAVHPETGPFFICVKSYSRPARPDPRDPGLSAREMAEALAGEVRQTYQVGAYLYEYISEEKRAEAEARARALQQRESLRASLEQYAQKSQLQGMQFLEPDSTLRYKTFRYRDQIAVLVGPFQTEADAVRALAVVKKWDPPKDKRLMDAGVIALPGKNGQTAPELAHLNPYAQAMVVANPSVAKAPTQQQVAIDPFIVRLNDGRPYNLLRATKGWTLAVKSFSAPVEIQSKESDRGVMKRIGLGKGADALVAGAEQAEQLAKALRDPRMKPYPFEAFVLHTRTASLVMVGQFDSPNDPELLETRRVLMGLTFNVTHDEKGAAMADVGQRLFRDNIMPMPIPKVGPAGQ